MGDIVAVVAAITITRRRSPWRDVARGYRVLVDGESVGRIRFGGTDTFEIPPGAHSVQVKVDWCSSPTLAIDVDPGDSVWLECAAGGSAWTALYALFRPGRYLKLERVPTG